MYYNHVYFILVMYYELVGSFGTCWWLWLMEKRRRAGKWVFFSWPLIIFFWMLWIFTPTKRDALLIVAGGGAMNFLTNDSTAKQLPHELIEFTKVNLQSMAQEAKVSLGIQSQKEKILEDAKNMTTNELLDRMKADSNFAKIITNR